MTPPTIITRDQWGAREPRGASWAPTDQGIICHHTTGIMRVKPGLAKEEMRAMQRYHQMEKFWADIGYHYVIDGAGRIYEGRGAGVEGAHCPGKNKSRIGIALMGNFEDAEPAGEQIDALVSLCRHFCEQYGYSAESVTAHRDHRATDCPGENLYVQMNDIRERIATGIDSLVADVALMPPRPLASLLVSLPEAHRRALARATPEQVSAMRVLASRLRDEITKPHSTLWDKVKESEQLDVAVKGGKVLAGAAIGIGFELLVAVLAEAAGLETDDGGVQ